MFGPDGALYVETYSGSYYRADNSMAIYRFDYVGGADTPGADPKSTITTGSNKVAFSIGNSGGVSYKWDFGDGQTVTTTDATTSHSYSSGGDKTVKLTVTYADGATDTKTITAAAVPAPTSTSTNVDVGVTVPSVLALNFGAAASFGALTPALDHDYAASTTATVLATSGNALLSVTDPSATAPGHLINGTSSLPSAVQAKATSPAGAGGAFAPVSNTPSTLLTYTGPANADPVTISFLQHVGTTDALRAGSYGKTLTFTLSTTAP